MVRLLVPYTAAILCLLASSSTCSATDGSGDVPVEAPVDAKAYRPVKAYAPYSSFVEGEAFYIGGGKPFGGISSTSEAFKIDLSVSWKTSNPKFKRLPDGLRDRGRPSAVSADGKEWLVGSDESLLSYNTKNNTWSTVFALPSGLQRGIGTGTDSKTGLVYFPNSSPGVLLTVNPATKSSSKSTVPALLKGTLGSGAAWSDSLGKLIFIGGKDFDNIDKEQFYAFTYNKKEGWTNIFKKMKDAPSPRLDFCLVPVYGGSKLVLFGGESWDGLTLYADIYILDVATMVWTRGPNIAAKDRRSQAACGASGDYFISWGGLTVDNIPDSTVVYNIKSNRWTDTFTAAPKLVERGLKSVSTSSVLSTPTSVSGTLFVLPSTTSTVSPTSASSTSAPSTSSPTGSSSVAHNSGTRLVLPLVPIVMSQLLLALLL